ncbi:MAG: hypothetical protein DRJ38_07325 [Thermoprotei archaeon]|nr:MAG: hypothetical protein DRJ38_07325 [Thermoprotei archaeon]
MRVGVVVKTLCLTSWGTGRERFEADIVTSKIKEDVPVIPSSSLKGVLRTSVIWAAKILKRHNLITSNPCLGVKPDSRRSPCGQCPICALFGYPGGPLPPLKVTPMFLVNSENDALKVFEKEDLLRGNYTPKAENLIQEITFIKIDDKTGTVARGALFTAEVVPPEVLFYGEILLKMGILKKRFREEELAEILRTFFAGLLYMRYADMGHRGAVKIVKVFARFSKDEKLIVERDPLISKLVKALGVEYDI